MKKTVLLEFEDLLTQVPAIDDPDTTPQPDTAADEFDEWLARPVNAFRRARVVRIDGSGVWLDIGSKFESVLPVSDWDEPDAPPKVGDEIPVLIEDDLEVEDGALRVVRVRVCQRPSEWDTVLANAKPDSIHSGQITRRIKGGFLVNIGVNSFLPEKHVPQEMRDHPEAFIGETRDWRIVNIDINRKCIQIAPVTE